MTSSLEGATKNWAGFDWAGKAKQWDSTTSQNKEAKEQSLTARKALTETTKQFKRAVKTVEQAGSALDKSDTPENSAATVKAIESVAKNCRLIVKAYQGSWSCQVWLLCNAWFVCSADVSYMSLFHQLITIL